MNPATATSVESFRSSAPLIGREQLRVLRLLREHGPGTAKEIAQRSGESIVIQKRLPELCELGLAERLGARPCSVSGKSATVWQAKNSERADIPPDARSTPSKIEGELSGERRFREESGRTLVEVTRHVVPMFAQCPDCGLTRRVTPGPHAPHYRASDGRLVDCSGREVSHV